MKVFLVTPFENGLAKRGTRFIDIAEIFYSKGIEVNYITTNFSHAYKRFFSEEEIKEEKRKRKYNIEFIPIKGYKKNISLKRVVNNFFMSKAIYAYLLKEVKDGDIVFIPSRPVDFIYYIAKLKKTFPKIKLVLDIRDIWPDAFKKSNIVFNYYCNYFLNRSIKYFDVFFHISPSFIKWLKRYKKDANSIFVPPGYNSQRFKGIVKPAFIKKVPLRLVFIGALQYQLDILPLIKAIGNNENFNLTIIGEDGKGQRYNECAEYIKKNKITNVNIRGVIDPSKVPVVLSDFDVGVIPMITNSFTNKLFDYIAMYLPILNLGQNDMAKFILENQIGWVTSFEPKEIISLLDSISEKDVNERINNISKIREMYDRNILYENIYINTIK